MISLGSFQNGVNTAWRTQVGWLMTISSTTRMVLAGNAAHVYSLQTET